MKERSSDRRLLTGLFFRLLPYQILLIVMNAVNGIVDSLYASNVIGKSAMSAIGLYAPFNHFLYAASIIFVSGSQMLYGRFLARDQERIHRVFTVDLLLSLGLSALSSVLLVLGTFAGATRLLVSREPDLGMLNRYIQGQALGIPALVLGQQLFSFLSLENRTRRTMAASLACFAAKAASDHLFVYVFSMGTFGLGLSSSISFWVFLAVQAAYYLAGKSEWKFSLRACRWEDAPQIVRLGYPGAISRFAEMIRCLIVNFLVLKWVGSVGLSAFAASNSFLAIIWSVPYGMVAVSRILFSISFGEKDRGSLVDVMRIALTRGMLLICGISVLLILSAEPLTRLFYQDPADPVYAMTAMGFRILPLCMPLGLVSLHFACLAQISEKKVLSIVLPITDGLVGVALFSFLLIPALKMNGLYIANVLNSVLCALVVLLFAWKELRHFPRSLEDLMAIPARFGASPEERIDISVRNLEEVVEVSRQVIGFCGARGVDPRRAYFAGLCMEEMAGNVVAHGFTKDAKPHAVDIRVVHSGDDVILRIRDDCRSFNPADRAKIMAEEDGGKNAGIRLVYKIAPEVSYQNLLGLNVLTIRI